jgi:signal peptidase I
MGRKSVRFVIDLVQVFVIAFLLSMVIRTYVVEARIVPTESMVPTIQVGDRLMFDKVFYKITDVNRFDIVMFDPPEAAQNVGDQFYVKRIIGLPGDTVQVIFKEQEREYLGTYVNGEKLTETYLGSEPNYNYPPTVVPDGMLFVLGDNRAHSYDSHMWGFLPMENLKGKLLFRFYPWR